MEFLGFFFLVFAIVIVFGDRRRERKKLISKKFPPFGHFSSFLSFLQHPNKSCLLTPKVIVDRLRRGDEEEEDQCQ